MSSIVEKSLIYAIGGIFGVIIGYTFVSRLITPTPSIEVCMTIITMASALGVLIAVTIETHRSNNTMEKNSKIRNETVALITHEMRTGLTSTGWAIQTIMKKYPDAISGDDKKMLSDVSNSIHTTVSHAVNLLDISLLDIGKLSISLEWTTLDKIEELICDSLEKFKMGAENKGVKFTSDIVLDYNKEVEVDRIRLRIILGNLLENALQYTIGEKKEIHVSVYNDDNNLLIKVSDTGIGIPKSEQGDIFKEFYRASNARNALSSGSGIGLYTSAQYVKAHKGTMRFDSEENVGTTFYVTLPLKTKADVHEFLDKVS